MSLQVQGPVRPLIQDTQYQVIRIKCIFATKTFAKQQMNNKHNFRSGTATA